METEERSWMMYGEGLIYPVYPEGYYERAEGSNYRNYGDDEGWKTILDVLGPPEGGKRSLLEVGCAKGYFVKHALDRGYDARGFDISDYAISKTVAPEERVYVWSAADPWFPGTETIDIVAGWEVMEHIYEKDVPYVLDEANRVLKPGGKLLLKIGGLFPNDDDNDHTHFTKRPRAWWNIQLRRAGFWAKLYDIETQARLDDAFRGRDWAGRFFVASKLGSPWRA